MKTIFVSSQNVDDPMTAELIAKLRAASFQVFHSPRNPLQGEDERWGDWYAQGLLQELDQVECFVLALDYGWDSSTWMMIEAEEARHRREQGTLRGGFFFNPSHVAVRNFASWQNYLTIPLPDDADQAVERLMGETPDDPGRS